jgi:hypothetical protein
VSINGGGGSISSSSSSSSSSDGISVHGQVNSIATYVKLDSFCF